MSFVDTDFPLTWCLTRGLSSLQCSAGTFSSLLGAITSLSSGFHLILTVRRRAKKTRDGTGSGFSRSHPLVQLRISITSLPCMRKHIGFMHRCQKTRVQACCALLHSVDPLLCGVALHSGPSSPVASHTKTLRRTHFSTLTFRFTRSEMSMEMYAAPCPFCGWRTHISRAFEPLETLTGDAGKLQEYTEFIY